MKSVPQLKLKNEVTCGPCHSDANCIHSIVDESAQKTVVPQEKGSIVSKLENLDLSIIKLKLMQPKPEGYGWSETQARSAETWYKRYLFLISTDTSFPFVPNAVIDAFWHQHILDTKKYENDCLELFGRFVHHYPYYGLNGDSSERDESFDETNRMYIKYFGEPCTNIQDFPNERKSSENILALDSASNCNDGGSGTGCGQGCSRGG